MEDRFPGAREAYRTTACGLLRVDRLHLSGNNFCDGREPNAVFVAEGKIAQQIAYSEYSPCFQNSGAMRSDSAQILHRIVESHRHGFRPLGTKAALLLYHCRKGGCWLAVRIEFAARCRI